MAAETTHPVDVQLRNDRWRQEGNPEWTVASVDDELARLFAYARCWAADEARPDRCDLTFSAMLAAMVAHDEPLCVWLRRYFDRLGVASDDIAKGRRYPDAPLYSKRADGTEYLATTISFREAFETARTLRDGVSAGQPIGVRHFMAAYAVCPNYHLRDFRRYRIDRREWCLSLAERLSSQYVGESAGWDDYATMAPPLLPLAFDNDTPDGRDHMHLGREVEAFARLIAARSTSTPLSIGVFGSWGSGKSFFMRRTRERVAALSAAAGLDPRRSEHHARIAQVEFNAWHYSEKALIASLVDQMFRHLRIDGADEDDETLRRRGAELMMLLNAAEEDLASAHTGVATASERLQEAELDLIRAERDLPEAVREAHRELVSADYEAKEAQAALDRAREQRDRNVDTAQTVASATAWVSAIRDETTSRTMGDAAEAVLALAGNARDARARWRPILIGATLLVATTVVTLLAGTTLWTQILGGVGAITAFATLARQWLAKLDQLADQGRKFEAARKGAIQAATERVAAQHAAEIADREAELERRQATALAARARLQTASSTHEATELLGSRRDDLRAAGERRADAQRGVEDVQAAIKRTSIDTLLAEFLDERNSTDNYRSQLGIFSQVRNDFERLSKLMTRASADHYDKGQAPPTLSRIVLYIDDLDRCPVEKVVEVLRAVHLLLAFELFVCVVAVDPRWLTTCLLSAPGVAGKATPLDAQFGKPADTADYIEKIFQVPIWLRPVPEDLRPALLRSWLEGADTGIVTEQPPMTKAELDFLGKLAPLLPSKPRTLKRLANTYRLVKTALSDVEFRSFTATDGQSGGLRPPFEMCMTQLAVLSADRQRAIDMIESLDAEKTATTVGAWLDTLRATDAPLSTFLRETLGDDLKLVEFRRWLERTRRYSFYL